MFLKRIFNKLNVWKNMFKAPLLQAYNPDTHSAYCYDFGRDRAIQPAYIATPSSDIDVSSIVKIAYEKKLPIAVRGHAHSTGGQPLVKDGVVIDLKLHMKKMTAVQEDASGKYIEIQAGASWKDVFQHCLPEYTPPTYSDYLELSVGGTISSGGVGQSSFKNGMQIDNLIEATVITGTGQLLVCSELINPELFSAIKAGFGHFGIITKIKMRLDPAPRKVTVFKLLFTDFKVFIDVQSRLTQHQQIDAIQSHVLSNDRATIERQFNRYMSFERLQPVIGTTPWLCALEVSCYQLDETTIPLFTRELEALTHTNLILHRTTSFSEHVNRVPPLLTNPLEQSKPKHHHCCVFIGQSQASEFLRETMATTTKENMGSGTILIIPLLSSKVSVEHYKPDGEGVFFLMAFLRRHIEEWSTIEDLERLNQEIYQNTQAHNGKIYPCGSGEILKSTPYWQHHYGRHYQRLCQLKSDYDPHYLFSTFPIFPKNITQRKEEKCCTVM
jgi:cytokinin dehydrogenase